MIGVGVDIEKINRLKKKLMTLNFLIRSNKK
jgi:phosphopantetheinyl transferase (holo-ACP synthase)